MDFHDPFARSSPPSTFRVLRTAHWASIAARTWGAAAGDGKQRRPYHEHAEADHICMNLKAANPTQILIHLGKMLGLKQLGDYNPRPMIMSPNPMSAASNFKNQFPPRREATNSYLPINPAVKRMVAMSSTTAISIGIICVVERSVAVSRSTMRSAGAT